MIRRTLRLLAAAALAAALPALSGPAAGRPKVAVYIRAYEVREMKDPAWLESRWKTVSDRLAVDKVYIETHRDTLMPDRETVLAVKRFFESRGVETAGGITFTMNERNRFKTFCYTRPDQRDRVRKIVEFTAALFDEVILDDFFFTNCKCESCIRAKGRKSWTRFRLDLMDEVSRDLVLGPARKVNPRVKMVIKYPNWYEHFQGLGFNLESEPRLFDGIYTGTETRDGAITQQHLQPYESFLIFRYFENVKPGGNLGGWVDTGAIRDLDRYAEQIWLTLFAKAPELTLFDFRQMLWPIRPDLRAAWQGRGTSFDFDAMTAPVRKPDGTWPAETPMAIAAQAAISAVDGVLGRLGRPVGVPSYKPFHSTGEDFLHNFIGMAGIPVDLSPVFPRQAKTVLLTECAAFDPAVTDRIRERLSAGGSVIITSGLLKALRNRGIGDIVELSVSDKRTSSSEFAVGWGRPVRSRNPVLLPQIGYLTNDSWEEVSFLSNGMGWPLLHEADYASGKLYVLTVPDNPADLYELPAEVLNRVRQVLCDGLPVRLEGPARVCLFPYDNGVFIAESFRDEDTEIGLVTNGASRSIVDLQSGAETPGETQKDFRGRETGSRIFRVTLKPHSFRVFECR
jgi:hypothetical protein